MLHEAREDVKNGGCEVTRFLNLSSKKNWVPSPRGRPQTARTHKHRNMSFVAQQIALVTDTARILPAKCAQLVRVCSKDMQHFSKPTGHYT